MVPASVEQFDVRFPQNENTFCFKVLTTTMSGFSTMESSENDIRYLPGAPVLQKFCYEVNASVN